MTCRYAYTTTHIEKCVITLIVRDHWTIVAILEFDNGTR